MPSSAISKRQGGYACSNAMSLSRRVRHRAHFEMHPGLLLQRHDDAEQVHGGRLGQRRKSDGGVDLVPQHRLRGIDVAVDQCLHVPTQRSIGPLDDCGLHSSRGD
jgi:hypothetical protein